MNIRSLHISVTITFILISFYPHVLQSAVRATVFLFKLFSQIKIIQQRFLSELNVNQYHFQSRRENVFMSPIQSIFWQSIKRFKWRLYISFRIKLDEIKGMFCLRDLNNANINIILCFRNLMQMLQKRKKCIFRKIVKISYFSLYLRIFIYYIRVMVSKVTLVRLNIYLNIWIIFIKTP